MPGAGRGNCYPSKLAYTKLVCQSQAAGSTTCSLEATKGPPNPTTKPQQASSIAPQVVTPGMLFIRQTLSTLQLSTKAQNVLMETRYFKAIPNTFCQMEPVLLGSLLDPLNPSM